jgi:hypothetical protein
MAWIKRNLSLVLGAVVALALMGFAGFYHLAASKDLAPIGTEETGAMKVPDTGLQDSSARNRHSLAAIPERDQGPSEIGKLTLRCRAVIPSQASGDAATTIAYALQNELRTGTNFFNPQKTELGPEIHRDRDGETFTFDVTVALQRPIKL